MTLCNNKLCERRDSCARTRKEYISLLRKTFNYDHKKCDKHIQRREYAGKGKYSLA